MCTKYRNSMTKVLLCIFICVKHSPCLLLFVVAVRLSRFLLQGDWYCHGHVASSRWLHLHTVANQTQSHISCCISIECTEVLFISHFTSNSCEHPGVLDRLFVLVHFRLKSSIEIVTAASSANFNSPRSSVKAITDVRSWPQCCAPDGHDRVVHLWYVHSRIKFVGLICTVCVQSQ
eukprot:SAG11_NODE_5085_length_1668_cov_2.444232_2_plen_176_part_00